MNIRVRHMAVLTYAGIAALGLVVKPELLSNMTDLLMITAPLVAMFTWDKIKGTQTK